jgi:SAM-dependent methyltransferase
MSLPQSIAADARSAPDRALPLAFAGTIFTSAFLLFAVQPMFTKMVLPAFGGSPAVWSVAMVFFQALLLVGYIYAHLSSRWLTGAQALAVHGVLVAAAFLFLPLTISGLMGPAPATGQGLWLIGLFALSVGMPFFVLAATAPLLQSWFARSGHIEAANPYKLYVASNLGSFLALIAYPLAIEPLLPLQAQTRGWMGLFAVLACALAASGLMALARGRHAAAASAESAPAVPITWRQRAIWTGLAMVPSGLLVAVTAHLSTDVASAPLMWVLPLALFLLTFILAFRDREFASDRTLVAIFTATTPFVVMSLVGFAFWLSAQLLLHLGVLFTAAMFCHRALYIRRPAPAQLTEFYLWMSFGGMLGGLLTGLVAPLVFDTIVEYRLLLIAALLCAPVPAGAPDMRRQLAFAAFALAVGVGFHFGAPTLRAVDHGVHFIFALVLGAAFLKMILFNRQGAVTAAASLASAFLVLMTIPGGKESLAVRSFFGVNYVRTSADGDFRLLLHGSTVHGAHRLRDLEGRPMTGRPQPTAYYHEDGGINVALKAAREKAGGKLGRVGIIGLGVGAMACHAAPGESWTYFEIDQEVVNLARRPELFPFLSACTPDARIVVGDGRLTIREEQARFDVIILDAFSSDAVPAHLLTREAFAIYAERLAPGGVIIAHVSNRYMDIRGVAEAAGLAQGMAAASSAIGVDHEIPLRKLQFAAPTITVAMSPDPAYLDVLLKDERWRRSGDSVRSLVWTDDYANIMGAMVRKLRE